MTSYISLLNKIEAFCNAHLQIKKYKGEFKEQMPNFSTMDEKYPVVFVVPTSDTETLELNQFTLDIYCVDIIQKDRANLNTIVSDCHLILKDLYLYFKDGSDLSVDVITDPTMTPLNNFDLDYVAGWVMTITFEVEGYSVCAIPMNPIPPFTPSCEDATYEITDTDDNVLYSGSISSGGNLDQVIQDSTVEITSDNGTLLHTVSVLAEGSAIQIVGDSTVTITDDSANTLYTLSVNAEGSATQAIQDSEAVLKDTAGATISTTYINAEGSANITAPDTALEVNGTSEGSVVAGATVDIQLSDSGGTVTPNSVTQVGNDLQIVLPDAVIPTPVGATLMKTGQTTSYRTGDDGDIEAGRATNFTTLAVNNPFGNTNRFTDELGGQTYANNIVIDWSTYQGNTVLGWDRRVNGGGANVDVIWNTAIDNAASVSIGTFISGWRLPNAIEGISLMDFSQTYLGYAPFSISAGATYWVSTTMRNNVNAALAISRISGELIGWTKTPGFQARFIAVRTFTVTGTTLS